MKGTSSADLIYISAIKTCLVGSISMSSEYATGPSPVSPTPSYEKSEPIKCDKDPFTTFSSSADQHSPRQSEAKPSYAKQDYSADKKERARANSENPFAGTDATDGETSRPAVTPGDLATDGSYELGVWSYHYNNNRY